MRPAATICVAILLTLGAAGASAQLMVDTTEIVITNGGCGGGSPIPKLQASGGSGDYEWGVVSGQLPPNLVLKSNGSWGGKMDWSWVYDRNTTTADIQVTDRADGSTAQRTVLFEGRVINFAGACSVPSDCTAMPGATPPAALGCALAGALAFRRRRRRRCVPSC